MVFIELKALKLSLSSAQTFEDFSLVVDRLLPLLLFFCHFSETSIENGQVYFAIRDCPQIRRRSLQITTVLHGG